MGALYRVCPVLRKLLIAGNLLVLFATSLCAQRLINTVAGADWIPAGDGRRATSVPLSHMVANVTVDILGNVYVADPLNSVVYRFGLDGVAHVIAGNGFSGYSGDFGPATSASLNFPSAVVLDSVGNLYIADSNNYRIRKVTTDGIITTVVGTGLPGNQNGLGASASVGYLVCLAVDILDEVYFCDPANHAVRVLDFLGFVTTVAGNGQPGSSGDGGLATSASLMAPQAITVDIFGNIFIADFTANVVRYVNTAGLITTVAGTGVAGFSGDGGPSRLAAFNGPDGVALDGYDDLYVSDTNNNRIRGINANTGIVTTLVGTGNQGYTGDGGGPLQASLYFPTALSVDLLGRLIVADSGNGRIRAATPSLVTTLAGNGLYRYAPDRSPAAQAFLLYPKGLAIDNGGALYIADSGDSVVRKVTADGLIQTVAGTGVGAYGPTEVPATRAGLTNPEGVAIAANGDLLIADRGNNQLHRVTADGVIHLIAGSLRSFPGTSGDGQQASAALLDNPSGVAVDAAGNIYVTELGFNSQRVRKISTNNVITTFAGNGQRMSGGDGLPATAASFCDPTGIALDTAGDVYIGEYCGYRIRKVTPDGRITTVAGTGVQGYSGDGGQAVNARIGGVGRMAFDAQGNLYFTDSSNQRVRQITPGGIISTVAGSGLQGFSGDGGPAQAATFNSPAALAVARDGTIYISDLNNNRVRAITSVSPIVTVSASSLSFSATSGGGLSAAQNVTLAATLQGSPYYGLPFSATVSTATGSGWLQVTPATGTMPATVGISFDPGKLNAGTYQGTIQISAPGATPPQISITVTATVASPTPPKLSVDSTQIAYTAQPGGANPFRVLTVSNSGGGVLNVTATAGTASGGPWLSVSPGSGTATPGAPLSLLVTASLGTLGPGTYTGSVTIAAGQDKVTVHVSLALQSSQANLVLSQTGLSFTAVAGGGVPLPQSFGIVNTGNGTMSWTATASTLPGGSNWLTVAPSTGTVNRPFLDASLPVVSVNASGLAAGDYYGRIDVTASSAGNSPQTVTIVLNVLPPNSNPGPQVQPNGLIFTGVQGGVNPGSQKVVLSNVAGGQLKYGANVTYVDGANWLQNAPNNAFFPDSGTATIVVQPDFKSLGPGASRAFLSLGFSDGSSRMVGVLAVVAPAGATGVTAKGNERFAGSCAPTTLHILPTSASIQQGFTANMNQPTSVEAQVVDDCGVPLTPDRGGAAVTTQFSNGDPSLTMVHTTAGRWSGTWQPRNASGGTVRALITAFLLQQNGKNLANQVQLNVTVNNGANVPLLNPGQVRNAASFVSQAPVAPGTLISIFGSNLADTSASSDTPLQTSLAGTQVLLGGRPVPLSYASSNQLNAQVPYGLPANTQLQLLVQRGSALSVGDTLTVAAAQPAIFTLNQQGTGQGYITNSQTGVTVDMNAPATAGDTVVLTCTGLGDVNPPVDPGVGPPDSPPALTLNMPTVTIGGIDAPVSSSVLQPGVPGVYLVTVTMPAGVPAGPEVPVVITSANQMSPPVTMAVQ